MIFLIFILLLLPLSFVDAATYWVSTSGNNGNPCTNTTTPQTTGAKLTIAAGIACMSGGDTLNIRAGTYNESITTGQLSGKSGSGLVSNPVGVSSWTGNIGIPTTIKAYGTEDVIIGTIIWPSFGGNLSYIVFEGDPVLKNLHVDGQYGTRGTPILMGGARFNGGSINHIKFSGVDARNFYTHGNSSDTIFGMGGGSSYIWSINNKVHDMIDCVVDNGFNDSAHAMYLGGMDPGQGNSHFIIENTEIYNAAGSGIEQYEGVGPGQYTGNVYRNNYIHDTGTNRSSVTGLACNPHGESAIDLHNSDGTTQVYGNLIINNSNGINNGTGDIVYNNTIWHNGFIGSGAYSALTSDSVALAGTMKNNIVFGNAVAGILDTNYQPLTGPNITNNFTSDPLFVNSANPACTGTDCAGFHLQTTPKLSGAIDYGTPNITASITIPPASFAGKAPDAGAYESGVGPPPVNIPPLIAVTNPKTNPFNTGSPTIVPAITGTASDPDGTVQSVSWSCTRCNVGGVISGNVTNTGSNFSTWSLSNVNLQPGINILVFTATDNQGAQTTFTETVTYTPTFPGASAVALWAFDEVAGNPVDSSGNGNGLTLQGGATRAPGKFGVALSLNGTTQYADRAASNSLNLYQSFTFAAWVFTPTAPNALRAVFSINGVQWLYANSDSNYCLGATPMISFTTNGNLNPATDSHNICFSQTLQTNQWTHLAVTYDSLANKSLGELKLYVNGVQDGPTVAITGIMAPTGGNIQVGRSEWGEFFGNEIDELRVYNFALPRQGSVNTTPNVSCQSWSEANNPVTPAAWSIIGAMNCPIIQAVPPLPNKWPAAASGLKVGTAPGISKWATQ